MDQEAEYLRRRELRELRMARRARCPRAKGVHRHLASVYASRRAALDPQPPASPTRWAALRALVRSLWTGGRTAGCTAGSPTDEVADIV